MTSAVWFALYACGCTHSVDIVVPVHDVPPHTQIVATIGPGEVRRLEHGHLERNGVVTESGEKVARLDKNDLVVIEASGGERFGAITVKQAESANALEGLGLVIAITGPVLSVAGSAVAATSVQDSAFSGLAGIAYFTIGLIGGVASLVIGLGLYALGVSQTIHVTDATVRF